MKKTSDELSLSISPRPVVEDGTFNAAGRTDRILNLVSDPRLPCAQAEFTPAGKPRHQSACGNWRPWLTLRKYPYSGVLVTNGRSVGLTDVNMSTTPATLTDVLRTDITCVMRIDGSTAIAMSRSGSVHVWLDSKGRLRWQEADKELPPVILEAVEGAPVAAVVPRRVLSRAYTDGGQPSPADSALITADHVDAYVRMCADAAAAGSFIQPVLASYRLLDNRGTVLYESPAVLLQHPSGCQCASSQALQSADGKTVEPYTMTASTWKLRLRTASTSDSDFLAVAAVQILMTPMFHPYNPSVPAAISLNRPAAGSPWAHVRLPGAQHGLGSSYGETSRRLIMAASGRLEELLSPVATVSRPFRPEGLNTTPAATPPGDMKSEAARLLRALNTRPAEAPALKGLLRKPHLFTAGCCAAGASVVAWGDLRLKRYRGYPTLTMAAEKGAGTGYVRTTVTFTSGECVSRTDNFFGNEMPLSFGPLITYPAPDAVTMTIETERDGQVSRASLPLSPDGSGLRSVFVAPALEAVVPLQAGAPLDVPADTAGEAYPDVVVFAPVSDPLAPASYASTGRGQPLALAVRTGSETTWEFGRERFVAATGRALLSIGVAGADGKVSVRVLDERGIDRRDALCAAGDTIYALTSGGTLLALDRRGSPRVLWRCCHARFLAFDSRRGELWAVPVSDDGAEAMIFAPGRSPGYYSRSIGPVEEAMNVDGQYVLCGTDGLDIISDQDVPAARSIGLDIRAALPSGSLVRPRRLALDISGTIHSLCLELSQPASGSLAGRRIVELVLTGACRRPLVVPLAGAPVRELRLQLAGSVGPDFRFHSATIN